MEAPDRQDRRDPAAEGADQALQVRHQGRRQGQAGLRRSRGRIASSSDLFGFIGLDLPGQLGLGDGRYLARGPDEEAESVLVLHTLGAARKRPRRPKRESSELPDELPLTRATVITPLALGSEEDAERWLEKTSGDAEARAALRDRALGLLNRALHVSAASAGSPHLPAISPAAAVAVRIGYGGGDDLIAGRWRDSRELPADLPRRVQTDGLGAQGRVAAVLGGSDAMDACETLVPRARLDLDAGRLREAALQIRVGLEALLAEIGPDAGAEQADDLATLDTLKPAIGDAANAALRGELSEEQAETAREAILLSERVLRRRRLRDG